MKFLLLSRLRRTPRLLLLLSTAPSISPLPPPPLLHSFRSFHDLPNQSYASLLPIPSPNIRSPTTADFQIGDDEDAGEDASMNEFLSRFVWAIRGKLADAFPSLPKDTMNAMLLVICQKVIARMDAQGFSSSSAVEAAFDEPPVELSEDLWKTILEVSNSVHEAMRRNWIREELKKYLHCDEVKEMCRFAAEVGVRGPMLREFRFKWAREKLEDVQFRSALEQMRKLGRMQEAEKGVAVDVVGLEGEKSWGRKLLVLPQRKGKIKYKIYGLDLSEPVWAEVAEKVKAAEKHFVPEEVKPIELKCRKVEERILALKVKRDDPASLLAEWAEYHKPKRVDWLALLERIKEHNVDLYYKVAELLLTEESFKANVRDYSKLMDAHTKADRIEEAEKIFNKMTDKGIMPDIITFIVLVRMYSKIGNLDRAKYAFESLRKEGLQPDLNAYTSMISAYVKAGLPKQGETLVREMESQDIKPTKEIYMELLKAYAEHGQVDGAQRIVNTMQFAGIQQSLESFTLLVETYGATGDPDQARGHFDQMMTAGHTPDDRCTASMMAAYMKKNSLDKALDLLLTLEKDGFQPGILTNTVLVDWLGRLQLVDEAERLLRKITEKGEAPFHIHVSLCDMYSRAGQGEKARKSLKILEARKQSLRADQFERIVNGLLAGGLVDDAKRIYDHMQKQGFAPSEHVKVALMAAQSIPGKKSSLKRGSKTLADFSRSPGRSHH